MVRHAPIHRRSGHSDIAICCGRNVRGSSPSTSVVPLSNQVTTLNHKRFKGFKMFSNGHSVSYLVTNLCRHPDWSYSRTAADTTRRVAAKGDLHFCLLLVRAAFRPRILPFLSFSNSASPPISTSV